MNDNHLIRIEWAELTGQRPRHAGKNARLDNHGLKVQVPLARLTLADGSTGFGFSTVRPDQAEALLGHPLDALFGPEKGVLSPGRSIEYPLWDLSGQRLNRPVYALAAEMTGRPVPTAPFNVPCYDTSLYFDDLHLTNDDEGAALIAAEARQGYERGHRAFKIKVGRGARHMPLEAGTRRDIAVIHAVRRMVGPAATMMIDANNGYNLNLARQVLQETADCQIHWLEEAFHEDRVLYWELKTWLEKEGLACLIADGEGQASPTLLDWARDGVIDVIQYDIFGHSFSAWLETGHLLDGWGVQSAPHHYGRHYGNYAACHLAAGLENFALVEWDEVVTPGLDTTGYTIQEGRVSVPATAGFGLTLDEAIFQLAVKQTGFSVGG